MQKRVCEMLCKYMGKLQQPPQAKRVGGMSELLKYFAAVVGLSKTAWEYQRI